MTERFYCVGCKSHYDLSVHEAVKKPSKGGSYRHSIVSQCPKGHKTTRICNATLYDSYNEGKSAESPLTEGPTPDGPPSEPTPVPSAAKGFSSRCEVHEAEFEACGCEKDAEYCKTCSVKGHDSCSMTKGCPCCDNTMEAHGYVDGDGKCACGCVFVDCECGPECKCGCATKKAETGGRTYEEQLPHLSPTDLKKLKDLADEWGDLLMAGDGDSDKAKKIREEMKKMEVAAAESFEATQVVGTMSPGVNLEALEPLEGGMENGYGDSLVPAHSFLPEGSGHVIGSQSTSHNYTPMHAETFNADDMYPYYELRMVDNGTWGNPVGDWDDDEEEMALAVWEQSVNDDGPYILIYWKDTETDGQVVAGQDFLAAEGETTQSGTGNRKAAIATAAAAIVIGLIYWKNRQE